MVSNGFEGEDHADDEPEHVIEEFLVPARPGDLIEADEVFRWMFRHEAAIDFTRAEDGDTHVALGLPLPSGPIYTATATLRDHGSVPLAIRACVDAIRAKFHLE